MNDLKDDNDTSFWAEVRKFNKAHPVWFAIIFLTILLTVSQIPSKVLGAEADTITTAVEDDPSFGIEPKSICRPSGTPDDVCLWSTSKELTKWRDGYFNRKSGFNTSFVFDTPVKARELIVDKVTARLKNQNTPIPANCAGSERCFAYQLYSDIVTDASCITKGIPTNLANTCAKTPESGITQQGIINGIDLAVCGTILAFGIFKGGAGRFVAGSGAVGCTWNLYKSATVPAS